MSAGSSSGKQKRFKFSVLNGLPISISKGRCLAEGSPFLHSLRTGGLLSSPLAAGEFWVTNRKSIPDWQADVSQTAAVRSHCVHVHQFTGRITLTHDLT